MRAGVSGPGFAVFAECSAVDYLRAHSFLAQRLLTATNRIATARKKS